MSAERPAPPVPSLRGEDAGAEAPVSPPSAGGDGVRAVPAKPRCKPVNRAQMTWAAMDVERLVPLDHMVRAIWELVGRLDLSLFPAGTKAVEGADDRSDRERAGGGRLCGKDEDPGGATEDGTCRRGWDLKCI
jgi:hypothetical protein